MGRFTSSTSLSGKVLRLAVVLLTVWAVPAATCTAAHLPQPCWVTSLARWSATDEKAISDAMRLVSAGDGTLALARMEMPVHQGRAELMALRHITTYLILELANSMGALPGACDGNNAPAAPDRLSDRNV